MALAVELAQHGIDGGGALVEAGKGRVEQDRVAHEDEDVGVGPQGLGEAPLDQAHLGAVDQERAVARRIEDAALGDALGETHRGISA